jgi:TM2 domain-containing membrane protein YozV
MTEQDITTFLLKTNNLFPPEGLFFIKKRMEEIGGNVDINQLSLLNFKNPNTSMVLSILGTGIFGIDRFYMGDIGLGIAKLCTCGGFCWWWIIDMFLTQDATRKKNYYLLMNTLNTLGNSSINTDDATNESAEDQPILEDNVPDNQ